MPRTHPPFPTSPPARRPYGAPAPPRAPTGAEAAQPRSDMKSVWPQASPFGTTAVAKGAEPAEFEAPSEPGHGKQAKDVRVRKDPVWEQVDHLISVIGDHIPEDEAVWMPPHQRFLIRSLHPKRPEIDAGMLGFLDRAEEYFVQGIGDPIALSEIEACGAILAAMRRALRGSRSPTFNLHGLVYTSLWSTPTSDDGFEYYLAETAYDLHGVGIDWKDILSEISIQFAPWIPRAQ